MLLLGRRNGSLAAALKMPLLLVIKQLRSRRKAGRGLVAARGCYCCY